MASWMYYQEDESVISDATFDAMAHRMLAEWDTIRHPHKGLVTREDLEAGSGYAIPRLEYPWWVRRHSREWLQRMCNEFGPIY